MVERERGREGGKEGEREGRRKRAGGGEITAKLGHKVHVCNPPFSTSAQTLKDNRPSNVILSIGPGSKQLDSSPPTP